MNLIRNGFYFLLAYMLIVNQTFGENSTSMKGKNDYSKYENLAKLINEKSDKFILIDVRTSDEYKEGHISGSINIPYDSIEKQFINPNKNETIIVYCRSGRRSGLAKESLVKMGYTNVYDFGSIGNWKGALVKGGQ